MLLVGLLCCPNLVFGEDSPLPPEIRILQKRRNEEIAKINNLYVKALEANRDKFTKAGDLENANLAQKLIAEIGDKEDKLSAPLSVQELLTKSKWTLHGTGHGYEVVFGEDGVGLRDDTKQRVWKWKLHGKILWCHWLNSGWLQFEVPDDPKSDEWKGKSKGGDRVTLSRVSTK